MRFFPLRVLLPFLCLTGTLWALEPLDQAMEAAWNNAWTRFYSPQTHQFYDFLQECVPGHELDHLPSEEEVRAQFPNVCGYGTGMEDCAISGGVMLSMIIDRYAATGDPKMKEYAYQAFLGLETCATVHHAPGFIARGVSPKAPEIAYINSSRDQVTHAVYSLWEYYRSDLCEEETRGRVREILRAVAKRMIQNVTPENNYDFLCADGTPCRHGICKMYRVQEHEAARLPMIYAAAWDATGDEEYYRRYRALIREAIDASLKIRENLPGVTTYGLLQMQSSLDLLLQLEEDPALQADITEAMSILFDMAQSRAARVLAQLQRYDLTVPAPDWRQAGGLNGKYREIWYASREAGELGIIMFLAPAREMSQEDKDILNASLLAPDYNTLSSCGIYDLLGAFWKGKKRESVLHK